MVLKILPETLRYRIRSGIYPGTTRCGDKSRFTIDDIRKMVEVTKIDYEKKELKRRTDTETDGKTNKQAKNIQHP